MNNTPNIDVLSMTVNAVSAKEAVYIANQANEILFSNRFTGHQVTKLSNRFCMVTSYVNEDESWEPHAQAVDDWNKAKELGYVEH